MQSYEEYVKYVETEAKKLIEENYADTNLTAAVVARRLNDRDILLPESGCYDSIRGRLSDYIKQVRIIHSKELLTETNMAVRDISDTCGFSGVTYFRSLFKTYVGIAPGQYRKKYKKKTLEEMSEG